MSFEGYYQLLCANGHANGSVDVYIYDYERRQEMICECGAPINKTNLVDQTNGCEGNPCICGAKELEEIEAPVLETCNLGHQHVIKPGRYRFGKVHGFKFDEDPSEEDNG